MKRTFFSRYALLILCIFCFLGPFALRGARMSMQRMTNRVKDWLPSDFAETADLEWFGRHFMGEQFVIVTWPGCSADDPRYQKLVDRIQHQIAPSEHHALSPEAAKLTELSRKPFEELTGEERSLLDRQRAGDLADRLGLCTVGDYHENWGQRGEKWLQGDHDLWYFITPEGGLYRWAGRSNMLNWMHRTFQRSVLGQTQAEGEQVATFGFPTTPQQPNEFHANPELLTARFFKSITTGPETLAQLTRKPGPNGDPGPLWPLGVDDEFAADEARQKALERLKGALYGQDGKQTCIMLTLSEPAKRDLRRVIGRALMGRPLGRLLQIATVDCGISEEELKLGGPPVDNVAIDEEGQITLTRLILLSAVVGVGLSLFLVRSIRITCMLFFIGGLTALSSLAFVWWSGGTVDAIMMSMPSLVYVLGISGGLHLVNYYRETVEEKGLDGAPGRMLKLGWKAASLCSITTALGLISLYTSTLTPIRNFGTYSALGVMFTLVLLFTFLPAALQLWPPRRPGEITAAGKARSQQHNTFEKGVERAFEKLGGFIIRRWGLVTLGCVLVIAGCSLGLFRIETSVHLIKFFDRDAKIIRDYSWLEANLAKLVPMELVVRVRPELIRATRPAGQAPEAEAPSDAEARRQRLQLDFLERMEIAARIQDAVARQLGRQGQGVVGQAMSVPTFAPDLPPAGYSTLRDPIRSVMNRKLELHRNEYLATDYLRIDRGTDPKAGADIREAARPIRTRAANCGGSASASAHCRMSTMGSLSMS